MTRTQAAPLPALSAEATGVTWDLSDLFAGVDDPKIQETLNRCQADAEAFAQRYRGKIAVPGGPEPAVLLAGVRELEDMYERIGRVASYAHLVYDSDTRDVAARNLQQKVEQQYTAFRNTVLFFDLEWLELEGDVAQRLMTDPALAPYAHYLHHDRHFRPHRLSEPEEKIVNEKDVTGSNAWQRLHTEITSSLSFEVEREGKVAKLNMSQVLALFHEPDRALRKRAHDALYGELSNHGQVLTFVYDTLIQDHLTVDRLRQYPNPMARRHLGNEVLAEAVDAMMEATESRYALAHDYFRLKARLLDLDRLVIYDQYAPLQQVSTRLPFDEAKAMVLESYGSIHQPFREIATTFFEHRWIDAEPRQGKRGGAYCSSPTPKLHPYVLCSYTGTPRDVMTVAHELGHGLHGVLARRQTLFNYHSSLPLAETASVFGEMMVFDRLVKRESDPRAKLGLLAGKIEDSFATVYRQNVLTRFEQTAFAARKEARLTPEELGDRWIDANSRYYGDAVQLTDGYRWGWSYIPHFIHTPFYCYAYVFGQLLVLALYRMYQEEGEAFVPKFVGLLEKGGSDSPEQLLAPIGVDFRDPAFWQKGLDELERLVKQAVDLADQLG
ncbi:MAG: M3 family oligoendopeptidase [Chloroflexi bacterium]|nr:M3 family oligoendopeptidase [Chloroflexota bacterium]